MSNNVKNTIQPKCSDPIFGYGIGNCCACNRFPVVLYKEPDSDRWRCRSCYRTEHGAEPANLVTA